MATKLLDTNVCVALMRGQRLVIERTVAETATSDLRVSSITAFELAYGAQRSRDPSGEMDKVRGLLSRSITVCDFTQEDGSAAGQMRARLAARGEMIGSYDLLIASHALARGWTMVTANKRAFAGVEDLVVEAARPSALSRTPQDREQLRPHKGTGGASTPAMIDAPTLSCPPSASPPP